MAGAALADDDPREVARLRDEIEQLRTALEASSEEMVHLAEDRDRLLRRVTSQARELQAANALYADSSRLRSSGRTEELAQARSTQAQSAQEQEELRVAFEEMQVLTEELEVANTSLRETNIALDQRVEQRTRELQAKNTALDASEKRLQMLVEGVPQLVWRAVDGGHWTWASPQWTAFTGQAEAASHDWGWLEPVHPDDRERVMGVWAGALERGEFHADYRLRHPADGQYRWFQTRATPVRNDRDEIVEWLGTSTDVEDLRGLQERQRVLLHELQHRVRNTLAIVRSLSRSTAQSSETVEDFAAHFEGRLNALARTQVVLTRSADGGVDLESLVREELLAQAPRPEQVEVEGCEVVLSAKAAEVLALAVHELATNALKYGALSSRGGSVQVRWATQEEAGDRWLQLRWAETGGRVVSSAPRREGFGTELITMRVPYELQGRGQLDLRPGGMQALIAFPLRPGDSVLQTNAPGG